MPISWNENFEEYTIGVLPSQYGWTGDNSYRVVSGKYINCYLDPFFPDYVKYRTVTKNININGTLEFVFTGYIGANVESSAWSGVWFTNSSNEVMFGIRMKSDSTKHVDVAYYGGTPGTILWSQVSGHSAWVDNVLYPFSFTYNTLTGKYTNIIWDGDNRPDYNGTTTGANVADVRFYTYITNKYDVMNGFYDDFYLYPKYPPKTEKYTKFPRWQKTKYGMRPTY